MQFNWPFDPVTGAPGDGTEPWTNGNPAIGLPGSIPNAAALNDPQAEICHFIDFVLGDGSFGSGQVAGNLQQLRVALETRYQARLASENAVELGRLNAGDRNTRFDFHSSDNATFDARLIRRLGVNGNFDIEQVGTGAIRLNGGGDVTRDGHIMFHEGNYDQIHAPGTFVLYDRPTAPPQTLPCVGGTFSRTVYPDLFAVWGTKYGNGDGATTAGMLDARAEFLRILDDGRGIDVGRALGSDQAQSIQSHDHVMTTIVRSQFDDTGGSRGYGHDSGSNGPDVTIEATGGAETRPRNIALRLAVYY